MKKIIPVLFALCFFFYSCITSSVVMKEMYSEYYAIAEQYYTNKNYIKALEYYSKAKGSSELVNSCNYKMARIYTQTGDYSTAYERFTYLLLQDPDNSSLMSSLAYVCGKKGDYEEAVKLYENILQTYTYDTVSMKNLIMIYNHMGKKDKALSLASEYAEKFPLDSQVFSLITEEKTEEIEPIDIENNDNETVNN